MDKFGDGVSVIVVADLWHTGRSGRIDILDLSYWVSGGKMNDLLIRLERAGGVGILPRTAPYSDKKALSLHLAALKAQGHSVVADEVYEQGQVSGDLRITHYLSCGACLKGGV